MSNNTYRIKEERDSIGDKHFELEKLQKEKNGEVTLYTMMYNSHIDRDIGWGRETLSISMASMYTSPRKYSSLSSAEIGLRQLRKKEQEDARRDQINKEQAYVKYHDQ